MHLSLFAGVLLNIITAITSLEVLPFKSPLEFKLASIMTVRERRGKMRPFCSEVEEQPFANCLKLRLAGKCDASSLMRSWCSRTCKFCMENRAPAHVPCSMSKFGCCADGITAARGKNRLGCPEMCQDKLKFKEVCKSYAKNGYCEIYHAALRKICPRSCQMCGKKIVNGCYNKLDDSKCKRLSMYGYCKAAGFKKRMAKLCGLTCESCLDKAPKISDITPKCAKEGCCWDRKTPLSKGCPPCKDTFPKTICPRFKLECPHIDRLQSVQMRLFCPATCGICNNRECKDDSIYGTYCKTWKINGECKRNKDAMMIFCKRTCNFC